MAYYPVPDFALTNFIPVLDIIWWVTIQVASSHFFEHLAEHFNSCNHDSSCVPVQYWVSIFYTVADKTVWNHCNSMKGKITESAEEGSILHWCYMPIDNLLCSLMLCYWLGKYVTLVRQYSVCTLESILGKVHRVQQQALLAGYSPTCEPSISDLIYSQKKSFKKNISLPLRCLVMWRAMYKIKLMMSEPTIQEFGTLYICFLHRFLNHGIHRFHTFAKVNRAWFLFPLQTTRNHCWDFNSIRWRWRGWRWTESTFRLLICVFIGVWSQKCKETHTEAS